MCTNWNPIAAAERGRRHQKGVEYWNEDRKKKIHHTVSKIRFMHSQKWNCAASFPIPTFMHLWAIYIFPESVCIFGCSKIGGPILRIYISLKDTWMWKFGDRALYFCFGNIEAAQFHFWEYMPLLWKREISWILLMMWKKMCRLCLSKKLSLCWSQR